MQPAHDESAPDSPSPPGGSTRSADAPPRGRRASRPSRERARCARRFRPTRSRRIFRRGTCRRRRWYRWSRSSAISRAARRIPAFGKRRGAELHGAAVRCVRVHGKDRDASGRGDDVHRNLAVQRTGAQVQCSVSGPAGRKSSARVRPQRRGLEGSRNGAGAHQMQ